MDCYVLIASSPCINTQKGKSSVSSLPQMFLWLFLLFPCLVGTDNGDFFKRATHSSTCLLVAQWTITSLFFCPPFQTSFYQELRWCLSKDLFPEIPLLIHELLLKLKDEDTSVGLAGNQVASDSSSGSALSTPPPFHKKKFQFSIIQFITTVNSMDLYGEQDTECISPHYLKFRCTTPSSVHLQATARPAQESIWRANASPWSLGTDPDTPSTSPVTIWEANFGIAGWLLSFIIMHGSRQRELSIRGHLIPIIFQQPRHVSIGNAVMVAAETDVVLFEFNGPKGSVEFSVLILTVHVDSTHKAH